ncbi:MAG: trypsin-like peptidase domain-containing protein [Syntrophales bacterium]|nr:trypsin-like peptidase domain-containing protein [Syntrophales bacterium]
MTFLLKDIKERWINRTCYATPRLTILLWTAIAVWSLSSPISAAEKTGPIDMSTAIIRVAKQTIPAVAHIEVTERQDVENPYLPFENDPFFRRFFNIPQMPKKFKREMRGLGSGMIIDAQGHILTNHHVAGTATKIDVLLANGDRYTAKRVGTDPKTDLAVIKINARGPLPHITFGDSDKTEVGEWVVAIGAPRGLDQTVTQGIISAKHRQGITDPSNYQDFLQTDAAINPGNSGGPLLNLQGQVIGVNAVIVSESGGFEGIGFTIPSNIAAHVARALIAHGRVDRGWLGVDIRDLTAKLAKDLHVTGTNGALVTDVVKGGPAAKAGMRKNDVIINFGGKPIADSSMLRNRVADYPIDREAKVVILRNGGQSELTVMIGNLASAGRMLAVTVRERLGVEVRAITPREIQTYNMDDKQGVAITRVDAKGPLGKAGFEVGDIILGIDNQPVGDPDNFIALASALKPKQEITLVALDHRTGNMGSIRVTVR